MRHILIMLGMIALLLTLLYFTVTPIPSAEDFSRFLFTGERHVQ